MHRRRFLVTAGLLASGVAGCGETPSPTQSTPSPAGSDGSDDSSANGSDGNDDPSPSPSAIPPAVGLDSLVDGLRGPLDVAFGSDETYVAEQQGIVHVLRNGSLRSNPLVDLREQVEAGGEKGLLGLALHPEFASNRRLYLRYSAPQRPGTPSNYSHTFVLAEFRLTADGTSIRPDSERTVLEIPQPQSNHNAGSLVFGPEGYLYVGVGDGGGSGDRGGGHVEDWYDGVAGGNGQDVTENLLGSILRIDVDGSAAERGDYAIPDDNPLVGRSGLDEHYAWGLRNPWRLSFDGDTLYTGDVGQNRYEEIHRVVAGGNYGWNVTEGTHCFKADECPDGTPESVRGGEQFQSPVVEYPHGDAAVSGIAVIVGNRYRGTAIEGLRDKFVFGDYRAAGNLFVADPRADDGLWPTSVLPIGEQDAEALQQLRSIERQDGELYVLGIGANGGGVYRLVPPE